MICTLGYSNDAFQHSRRVKGVQHAVVIDIAGHIAEFAHHYNILACRISTRNNRSAVRAELCAAMEYQLSVRRLIYVSKLTREILTEAELQVCRDFCAGYPEIGA